MFMYLYKRFNPGFWVGLLSGWYRALQNKYYFDDLYIKGLIKRGLLPLNNFLAFVDMGIYDKYAVDGWEKVNKVMFSASKWFDNLIVDKVAVDGAGSSVKAFNVLLRVIQSGKIQFYFIMIILVLAGYIWTLNI